MKPFAALLLSALALAPGMARANLDVAGLDRVSFASPSPYG